MDEGVDGVATVARFQPVRVRHRQPAGVFAEPLVCYQQLQQDQGQGGGPIAASRLTQLSLTEEITWI
ncbi:MAG: hypothetical protein ACOYMY_08375 [Prochlorococcaceae cyanobacterium]|jgi:hypothetical protein